MSDHGQGDRVTEIISEIEDISREHVASFITEWCVDVTNHSPPVEIGWTRHEDGIFGLAAAPTLTPAEERLIAMGGCPITSTLTPSLSGVYAADGKQFQGMAAEAQGVGLFHAFSSGETIDWPVRSGYVTVSSTDQFLMLFRAVLRWRSEWQAYEIGSGPKPADSVAVP